MGMFNHSIQDEKDQHQVITFPIDTIFVEGPDLSGKTTLIKKIHQNTEYRWHMIDRSKLSRAIFSSFYNRDHEFSRQAFLREISNLNNRYIFLLPHLSILQSRLRVRGDEIHDENSLEEIYACFHNELTDIRNLPNVKSILSVIPDSTIDRMCDSLLELETPTLDSVSRYVFNFVDNLHKKECTTLSLTLYDDGEFKEADSDILMCEGEADYYKRIYNDFMKKIDDELKGNNEYNRIEDSLSRRFIFTEDTCISLIHATVRDGLLDLHCVCRSTDVKNKFPHDLKFLYFLASNVAKKFEDKCKMTRLRINLNAAHIIE